MMRSKRKSKRKLFSEKKGRRWERGEKFGFFFWRGRDRLKFVD